MGHKGRTKGDHSILQIVWQKAICQCDIAWATSGTYTENF